MHREAHLSAPRNQALTRVAALAAAVLTVGMVTGCAGQAPAPGPALLPVPPEPVRTGERPLTGPGTVDGDTLFQPLGLTTGMASVIGSHADLPAKGEYVRLRVLLVNTGRNSAVLDPNKQLLVTGDGGTHAPDPQAMLIKRQPEKVDLGTGNRTEFDLFYDVPAGAVPTALRAFGGPTLADLADTSSVDVALDRPQ